MRRLSILVILATALLLGGCASGPRQYDPAVVAMKAEVDAYGNYLMAEVQAGRMSKEQAQYLYQAKWNEIFMRAAAIDAMKPRAASPSYAAPVRRPATPVYCSTTREYNTAYTTCQ